MSKLETHKLQEITSEKLKHAISTNLQKILASRSGGIPTQEELSKKSGISKGTISKIVNGKITLSLENAIRLASSLGISLDFLCSENNLDNNDIGIISKCISPVLHSKTFHDDVYPIRAIKVSEHFGAYLHSVWDASGRSIPEDVHEVWLKKAKSDLLASLHKDVQGKTIEYALIPTNQLHSQRLLEDLGIPPENHQTKD